MHELPDEYLADALPIAKKIAIAQGVENYNILQVRVFTFFSALPLPLPSAADLLCRYRYLGFHSSNLVGLCDRTMGVSRIRYDKR